MLNPPGLSGEPFLTGLVVVPREWSRGTRLLCHGTGKVHHQDQCQSSFFPHRFCFLDKLGRYWIYFVNHPPQFEGETQYVLVQGRSSGVFSAGVAPVVHERFDLEAKLYIIIGITVVFSIKLLTFFRFLHFLPGFRSIICAQFAFSPHRFFLHHDEKRRYGKFFL